LAGDIKHMDLLFQISGIIGVAVFSFGFGLFWWFIMFRSTELPWLQKVRAAMIAFAVFAIVFAAFVGFSRIVLGSKATLSDSEQRWGIIVGPCLIAAVAFPHIAALQLRIRRLRGNR
jgi:hypothetical protein